MIFYSFMISVRRDHWYCNCPGRQPSHLATPITYIFTPCSRVLLENLIGLKLVKKFPPMLWSPIAHFCVHNLPRIIPILSQLDPIHTPTVHFLNIHLNIIFPSRPVPLQRTLSLTLTHQSPVHIYPITHTHYMPCPSHSSRFYHSNNIGWAVQII